MDMEDHEHLPDRNRMSVVIAAVMLAYAITPFVQIAPLVLQTQLPGLFLSFTIDFSTLSSLLAAALAATGSWWLLLDHPLYPTWQNRGRHWLLPALTAWVIGVPLNSLEAGPEWWALFGLGGVFLVIVLLAEYIAFDPEDVRHAPAAIGLTALSFALFLLLSVSLKATGLRLFLTFPAITLAVGLAALRTLYLRLGGVWHWKGALVVALVTAQIASALHYFPLSALQYGLLLTGLAYALTSIVTAYEEERTGSGLWLEPTLMFGILLLLAVLIRG
ncbi:MULTISPECIES: hypothetical protein [Anaerolinea]|uniref:DUF5656 family protein n=1 Tax=Anaerolinea TaxID=233189 RepID=UPI00260E3950|nr:hypothetical protein [Anaerolinea thermophila]